MIGGIYAFQGWFGGPWAAYQVTAPDARNAENFGWVALDWSGTALPTSDEVPSRPHNFKARSLDQQIPRDHHLLRTEAPLAEVPTLNVGIRGFPTEPWWLDGGAERAVPQEPGVERRDGEGGFSFVYRGRRAVADAVKATLDWEVLRQTPQLAELAATGPIEALPALAAELSLTELTWTGHGRKGIDLGATGLLRVGLSTGGLTRLNLPVTARYLTLRADGPEPTATSVAHEAEGRKLSMTLEGIDLAAHQIDGLPALSILTLNGSEVDLKAVFAAFPNLCSLSIRGRPTVLKHPGYLRRFGKLRRLLLVDCFGLTANDCPTPSDMPLLDDIFVMSVPSDVATHFKRLQGEFARFHVAKPRGAAWLAANLDNPFRGWDGRDGISVGDARAAARAWREFSRETIRIQAESRPDRKDRAVAIVTTFLQSFSQLSSRLGTMEREEVACAAYRIADASGDAVSRNEIDTLFGHLIDF